MEIVGHSDIVNRLMLLSTRQKEARTFGWLGPYRRPSRDHDVQTASSEIWVYLVTNNPMDDRPIAGQ